MLLLIIFLLPIITGLLILFLKNTALVRVCAFSVSAVNLIFTLFLVFTITSTEYNIDSLYFMGAQFTLGYDGISLIMLVLNNLLFPFIFLSGFKRDQKQVQLLNFLILFTQSALIGVFLAKNAFLFYVFWELTLIPVYFILLLWGGENRKTITLKFFIYTVSGSLFLLFGIIYLYLLTPGTHSTDFSLLNQLHIPVNVQIWLFWVLFIAFAIKLPIFPFHSWQPTTYSTAPTQGVMILAGVMTKMGVYGALRFLFPIIPQGVLFWQNTIIILSLIGVVYASIIAFRQTNLKKLIAFSSMAHISLIVAAMFAANLYSFEGLLLQSFSHGIIVVALFYMANLIVEKTSTLDIPQMGGLKHVAPNMSLLLLLLVLGSIALPLTSSFVGEFLMLTGLFELSFWFALVGGLTMIFGAIYMLYVYQRIMLGEKKPLFENIKDLSPLDYCILLPLIAIIFIFGVYPQPIFDLIETSVHLLSNQMSSVMDFHTLFIH